MLKTFATLQAYQKVGITNGGNRLITLKKTTMTICSLKNYLIKERLNMAGEPYK
jgi:hypothetical protein